MGLGELTSQHGQLTMEQFNAELVPFIVHQSIPKLVVIEMVSFDTSDKMILMKMRSTKIKRIK